MRQTLFTIDQYLFEDHWILLAWLLLAIGYFVYQLYRGNRQEAFGFVPVVIIVGLVIEFVLPRLSSPAVDLSDPNGPLILGGLAIRGFGLFLLLGMICGFGLALYRCHQIGFDGEQILSLGFWMVIVGLIGARLFYIIQKFDQFSGLDPGELLFKLADMTSGGLVVYGSLIGGIVAGVVYMSIRKMPWRIVIDIIAPGMVMGLAIGRIGCLMNGCCFGGICGDALPAIQFPPASAPYFDQLYSGQLLGIDAAIDEETGGLIVNRVESGSIADEHAVVPGDRIRIGLYHELQDDLQLRLRAAKSGAEDMQMNVVIVKDHGPQISIPVARLPNRSLPVHPTQLYSAINALLLCGFLWFYYPWRRSDGEVFALMMILYAIGRFLLELIRTDETGQFGTNFTISQWLSFAGLAAGGLLLIYLRKNVRR